MNFSHVFVTFSKQELMYWYDRIINLCDLIIIQMYMVYLFFEISFIHCNHFIILLMKS